jgi:hypothetical protein
LRRLSAAVSSAGTVGHWLKTEVQTFRAVAPGRHPLTSVSNAYPTHITSLLSITLAELAERVADEQGMDPRTAAATRSFFSKSAEEKVHQIGKFLFRSR